MTPPVVLLHGFPETRAAWDRVAPLVEDAGFDVHAIDLPGYGDSPIPDGYGLEELVGTLAETLEVIGGGGPIHLAGHDWGAILGWSIASWRPELVARLVALSVPHPVAFASAIASDPDQTQRSAYIRYFAQPEMATELLLGDGSARLRAIYDAHDPGQVDGYVESLSRPGRMRAALDYYGASFDSELNALWAGEFPLITAPTLMVWGDSDRAVAKSGVEASAVHVAGPYRMVTLEGAGHWLLQERATEVADLLIAHFSEAER